MSQNKESFPSCFIMEQPTVPPKNKPSFSCYVSKCSLSACLLFPVIWEYAHAIHQPAASKIRMKLPVLFSEQTYVGISPTITAAVANKPVT